MHREQQDENLSELVTAEQIEKASNDLSNTQMWNLKKSSQLAFSIFHKF